MSKWIKIKTIFGIAGIISTILLITFVINFIKCVNNNYDNIDKIEYVESNLKNVDNKLNVGDDWVKIVKMTAEKNSDWSKLPLSKSFKKKYNSQYGILGKDDNYTYLSSNSYESNEINQTVVLNVDHEYKQEYYYVHYTLNENNELDDVEIVDKKLLYDENGNKIIYKESISEENYEDVLIKLADPYNINHAELEIDFYNLTENYISKWSGGFVDSRGFDYYSRYIIKELSSFKKRIVYMKCEYPKFDKNGDIIDIDEELTLYYKVKFFMNTDLWLDDVEVEEVSKKEVDRLLNEKKP